MLESRQISIGEVFGNCVLSVWRLQLLEAMHSDQELADTHLTYGLANGNAVVAGRLYQARYAGRRCPDGKTFFPPLNLGCLHPVACVRSR
jgi:hypothetical protein